MSSPKDPGILSSPVDARPGSPVAIRPTASPNDIGNDLRLHRHSPTVARSFDPNDPEVRERQRTMDVDMAMHLSRARRETVLISPSSSPYEATQPAPAETLLPISALSEHEERQIGIARGETIHEEQFGAQKITVSSPQLSLLDLHQTAQDPTLVSPQARHHAPLQDSESVSNFGLPVYQDNVSRTDFDFTPMEQFAAVEKAALGLPSAPSTKFSLHTLRQTRSRTYGPRASTSSVPPADDTSVNADATPVATSSTFPHRKLSESNPNPRVQHRRGIGGKMALFEGSPNHPSLPARLLSHHTQALPQDGFPALLYQATQPPTMSDNEIPHTGHDRPYRFSFYSNSLAATIHARSLSELPADGQTFEELFTGISPGNANGGDKPGAPTRPTSPPSSNSRPGTGMGFNRSTMVNNSLDSSYFNHGGGNASLRKSDPKGGGNWKYDSDGDSDAKTWWLDVQSPTDEEMKMLSKVFSIHPLTTEDIQMEETREKIELFRNYYFVCFRSFDQDQYSPTYLEPLNMYIIVFREGILSFHFRPTPHPQNVRRRIKQLKDYINVTSDWISYALIDDITDAFGPLIQSIEYEVDSIDDLVLILKEAEQSDMLRRIGTCRKKVMGLLRLMGNKADVVKGLAKRCNENWRVAPTSDIGLYLSDIQDHLITMTQNLNHYEKILSRSHSNYLAQISIEMTDANNQINDVLSKLTALGTVLIPMNLITGLWGMNVHVPGQGVDGYAWFISIIAGLAAFACIGGYSTYKFMVRR